MKTKEEILAKHHIHKGEELDVYVPWKYALHAMQEYTDQECAELRRQIDELKAAKPDIIVPGEEEQYQIDKENHETFMRGYYACMMDAIGFGIISQYQWESIRLKYDSRLHMDRPDKPGYYRANND